MLHGCTRHHLQQERMCKNIHFWQTAEGDPKTDFEMAIDRFNLVRRSLYFLAIQWMGGCLAVSATVSV